MDGPSLASLLKGEEDPIAKRGTLWPRVERKSGKAELGLPEFLHSPWEALKRLSAGSYQPGTQDEQAVKDSFNLAGILTTGGLGMNWAGQVPKGVLGSAGGQAPTKGITAYHGSPHDFDKFDSSRIGTGEGAQAYGHGLYFSQEEAVARSYRDNLAAASKTYEHGSPEATAKTALEMYETIPEAVAGLRREAGMRGTTPEEANNFRLAADLLENDKLQPGGRMYEVRIKADPESFLDWDKPLSQQSEAVRKAIAARDKTTLENYKPVDVPGWGVGEPAIIGKGDPSGSRIFGGLSGLNEKDSGLFGHRGNQERASQVLKDLGIPGIKYLDQGSRGAGEGSRNYVVFDADKIEILKKYGWVPAGMVGGGMMMTPPEGQGGS